MGLKSGTIARAGFRTVISFLLLLLAVFMLKWGLESRLAASGQYDARMISVLSNFPKALLKLGNKARALQNNSEAIGFYRRAVQADPLEGRGWIRLAEAEKDNGNRETALGILAYVHSLGKRTLRWTWGETLLALDLKDMDKVWENLNRLIAQNRQTGDALQLADTLLAVDERPPDQVLDASNLPAYLRWLTRWGHLDRAVSVYHMMARQGIQDSENAQWLIARLLSKKRVPEALSLGGPSTGQVTNGGFENELSQKPFDWRYSDRGNRGWTIKRVMGTAVEGGYALAVTFDGQKNASFSHLSQVVPVSPGSTCRLKVWWKAEAVTTDQGVFLEVYGYDAKGLHKKSPMLLGTRDWETVEMDFQVPEDCHAVVIRLRRYPSRKLDSHIKGTVWLDGVEIRDS